MFFKILINYNAELVWKLNVTPCATEFEHLHRYRLVKTITRIYLMRGSRIFFPGGRGVGWFWGMFWVILLCQFKKFDPPPPSFKIRELRFVLPLTFRSSIVIIIFGRLVSSYIYNRVFGDYTHYINWFDERYIKCKL